MAAFMDAAHMLLMCFKSSRHPHINYTPESYPANICNSCYDRSYSVSFFCGAIYSINAWYSANEATRPKTWQLWRAFAAWRACDHCATP
uniref:Secreted protein n=1 Tax=Ascaris lumbricoides TaxID=6252 RepID=A0A0M3HX92_ASCLU